jgi:hypothetical protein
LVGRWETKIQDEKLGSVPLVYHFTENGEIKLEQKKGDTVPFSIPFGTYSVEGGTLTVSSDGESSVFTFSVSEEKLTLYREGQEPLEFSRV